MHPWWNSYQGNFFGAIGGSAFGLFGGIFGTIAGLYVPRGKARRLVYGMLAVLVCVGVVGLCAGILALASHQPYGVWYPLTLLGGIASLTSCWAVPLVRYRYRQAENRRLDAEQLRRG